MTVKLTPAQQATWSARNEQNLEILNHGIATGKVTLATAIAALRALRRVKPKE